MLMPYGPGNLSSLQPHFTQGCPSGSFRNSQEQPYLRAVGRKSVGGLRPVTYWGTRVIHGYSLDVFLADESG